MNIFICFVYQATIAMSNAWDIGRLNEKQNVNDSRDIIFMHDHENCLSLGLSHMNCKLATLQEYSDPMHAVHGYSDSSDDDRAKRTINCKA